MTELLTLADVEAAARERLTDAVWAYIAGGAGEGRTVRANTAAFDEVWLLPAVLGATGREPGLRTAVLGSELDMPLLLAPTSPQRLIDEDAELATARAAATAGVCSIVSSDSHHGFASVATAAPRRCWFQLYAYQSRETVAATIAMAEESGATALVLTVDAHHPARRVSAQRAGFITPPEVDFGNLRALGVLKGAVPAGARLERLPLTWDDLTWIRERTRLPMFVKGVLRACDARRCVEHGADGVIVSNHGGRQLDSALPSLTALPPIASEIGHQATVLVDGGVRSGVDIVKALALGADAVCIGRPYLWGLALGGQAGVESVLALLRRELADTLLQLGIADVGDLDAECAAAGCPAETTFRRMLEEVG
jgi:4-hydroxymandelate oxidase